MHIIETTKSETPVEFPDVDVAFCARHLEPLRATWPVGFESLCLSMTQTITGDERFTEGCLVNPATGKIMFTSAEATARLRALCPLCCFLGDEIMAFLIREALEIKLDGNPETRPSA